MNRLARPVATIAGLLLIAPVSRGQAPRGYDTLSVSAVAESIKVLARVEQATRANPHDTAAWFHRGMLALTLSQRARLPGSSPIHGVDAVELHHAALDAFTHALNLDDNNAQFWLWLGHFYVTEGSPAAGVIFRRALERFRETADTHTLVDLLTQVAEDEWDSYNAFETRAVAAFKDADRKDAIEKQPDERHAVLKTAQGTETRSAQGMMPARPEPAHPFGSNNPTQPDSLHGVMHAAGPDTMYTLQRILGRAMTRAMEVYGATEGTFESRGEDHFLAAQKNFQEAYALAPTDEHLFRALARVHVARDQWPEFAELANGRVARVPADPWGWMALGLADQRLKSSVKALAAFDTGFARMTPALRAKLDRLDRVLRGRDAVGYVRADSATRAKEAEFAWLLAEPLWSVSAEKPRTEFLARIAFAEFRWSNAWTTVLGADTPKGDIYVRYGPPDMKQDKFWLYNSGLIFAFSGNGIARGDYVLDRRIEEWQPSRWDNIAKTKIDSMPIQVARFRASADSVDVFLATRAPMAALDSVSVVNTAPYASFWFSGLSTPDAFKDSLSLRGTGLMSWTRRVPVGPYYYRVESVVPGTLRAGRAAASMTMGTDTTTGFSMRGFAISDLIVASHAESSSETPRRWSGIDLTPVLAPVSTKSEVSLVWETYELGHRGTSARYDVTIKLLRQTPAPTFGGKIGARIVRGITGAVGVDRKEGSEGVTFRFERDVPYAPALVDNVTLSLDGTPPGEYILRLEVTDRVTGRTTSRATGVVIHE